MRPRWQKPNLEVARKQRDLTKAGAWVYDIDSQEKTYNALNNSYLSASALLAKYTLRAPEDRGVMAINPVAGSFVSTQGAYDSYTQAMDPVLVLGTSPAKVEQRALLYRRNSCAAASRRGQDEGPNVDPRGQVSRYSSGSFGSSHSFPRRSSSRIKEKSAST